MHTPWSQGLQKLYRYNTLSQVGNREFSSSMVNRKVGKIGMGGRGGVGQGWGVGWGLHAHSIVFPMFPSSLPSRQ